MSKLVLVIDDSSTVRQQVRTALRTGEFEVVEAGDGVEGAEAIAQHDVALVICDVHMPRMDGLAMLESVKRDPKNATLPIIMLTTEGQPELIQRAKTAGAKGWIVKPFKPDLLLAAVRKITAT